MFDFFASTFDGVLDFVSSTFVAILFFLFNR